MTVSRREFVQAAALAAVAQPLFGRQPADAHDRRILYMAGHLDSHDQAALRRTAANFAASRFNVLILAFLHVRYRAGRFELSYNALPAGSWSPALPPLLRGLTDTTTLISIGGWGNRADFEAIRDGGVEKFLDVLAREVIAPLALSGIDLDLEPTHAADNTPAGWLAVHRDLGATLVALTRAYRRRYPAHVVTHAPISSVAATLYLRDGGLPGVPGPLLEACGEALSWINVQLYEAGDVATGMTPSHDSIAAWWAANLRTADPRRLVAGFEPHRQALSFCRSTLAALGRRDYFLWDYSQIATRMSDWGTLA